MFQCVNDKEREHAYVGMHAYMEVKALKTQYAEILYNSDREDSIMPQI